MGARRPDAGDEPVGSAGPDDARPTRRGFLHASGWGAAGLAAGAIGVGALGATRGGASDPDHDARYGFTPLPARPEPGFDHLVVLMFENRSFDQMLGRLYAPGAAPRGQSFEGLLDGVHRNAAPDGSSVEAHVYAGPTDVVFAQPDPDPGETYPHVNTQFFGRVDPATNADIRTEQDLAAPFNAPDPGTAADMSGFVHDYVTNYRVQRGQDPTPEQYRAVMGGFTPGMLPVLSTLARSFTVFDHWHCAVPSQTFCNRSFFHASTSHGYVTNAGGIGPDKWLDAPAVPTVFDRLEEAGKTWRVYYDADQVVSLTGLLHAPSLERYWKTNFRSMEQFAADARDGRLPDYAFIEPRMVFDHDDMHPPENHPDPDGPGGYVTALSDIRAGEALLAQVYSTIRGGASTTGSNAVNTALLVTFDEHGGIYDHVPPPTVEPPSGRAEPGEMGFTFDRLGARVPAVLVSAYVPEGTVDSAPRHHGAVAKTLAELHGLEPLTERDRHARGLLESLTLDRPRQPQLWPDVFSSWVPPNPEAERPDLAGADRDRPLTSPAKGLLGLLMAKYEPHVPVPKTFGDAYDKLHEHGDLLFGTRD